MADLDAPMLGEGEEKQTTAGKCAQEKHTAKPTVDDQEVTEGEGSKSAEGDTDTTSAALEASLRPTPQVPGKKLCGVCHTNEPKYKCSRCLLPHCSVQCSTLHKATHPADEPRPASLPPKPQPPARTGPATAGTVDGATRASRKGPFAALDDSQELQALFHTHPQLRTLLEKIDRATLPPTDANGRSHTLGGKPRKDLPWTPDRGLQKGIQELNHLRSIGSKDGKAVREYSKLILRILSPEDGVSARDEVEKELTAENQQIVQNLLNLER